MVSDIEIRLRADIARLQEDMAKARQAVGGSLDKINAAVGKTVGLLGGLAIGAGAVSFGRFIKGSIDAADALNDLSARSKVAVEDLAGLNFAAKMTGTTLEGAAGAVNKLSQNIGKDTEKFHKLGVTAKEPIEAFKQLADIFKSIQDPQQRAAFGAATLGKSWAEVAPLLDEGAAGIDKLVTKGKALSGVTEEMAQDAAAFNDKIDELAVSAQGFGTRLAADLLPFLSQLTDDLTTSGDAAEDLSTDFSPLTETLRALVIVGGNIAFTFKAVGTEIGVVSAQVGQFVGAVGDFLTLDVSGGMARLRGAFGAGGLGDMAKEDAEKARVAFDAWEKKWLTLGTAAKTGAAEVVAASGTILTELEDQNNAFAAARAAEFLKSEEIAAGRKKQADEAAKAIEKEQSAYEGLIATLREKQAINAAEITSGHALGEAQKTLLKLDQDLASGKLVLTKAHEAEVRAVLGSVASQEAYMAAAKRVNDAVESLNKERDASVKSAAREADALEEQIANFGEGKKALEEYTLARMENELQQRAAIGLTADEIEQLQKLIAEQKRIVEARGQLEVLEEQKKATEEATKAQKEMWSSIDKTAHDTFVSILDGGKGLAERLKATLKNTFFDWLYQMTIKKWIISIGTSVTGGLISGAASAATGGGGGGGALGTLGSIGGFLSGAGSIGGALAGGAGWLTGATTLGGALGAGTSLIGAGAAGILPGLGMIAGALAPIGLGIAAAVKVFDKAFGRGPKQVTSQGITGTFGPEGLTGAATFQEWLKKGGWFRSDKRGVDTGVLDAALFAQLDETYKAIKTSTSGFAEALGVSVDSIQNYSKDLRLVLTGDAAKDQQIIADALAGIANDLATQLVPNLEQLAVKGESAGATLQRVATNYVALDTILKALGDSFGAVGIGSLEARERLIGLAGGIDKLAANAQVFAENFLTEAERLAPVQKHVADQLAAMGLSAVTTRDQFKTVVMGLDLTTEAGAKQYAAMLELAGAFAQVTQSADQAAQAAREAEDARKAAAQQAVQDAYAGLQKAVSTRQDALRTSFQGVASSLDAMIARAKANVEKMRAYAASLRNTAVSFGVAGQSPEQTAASSARARQEIAALAASRKLPSQEVLQKLIESAQRQPAGAFGSFEEFQRAQFTTGASLSTLAGVADKRADASERMIGILQAEKAAAEAANLKRQEQLNAILEAAKRQADIEQNALSAIQDIPAAIASLASALRNAASTGVVVPGFASGGMHAGGLRLVGERGPELEVTGPARYYSTQQTSTMTEGNNSAVVEELRVLNTRMASMEQNMALTVRNTGRTAYSSDQLARQFDQVSAGGNALVTEAMA